MLKETTEEENSERMCLAAVSELPSSPAPELYKLCLYFTGVLTERVGYSVMDTWTSLVFLLLLVG